MKDAGYFSLHVEALDSIPKVKSVKPVLDNGKKKDGSEEKGSEMGDNGDPEIDGAVGMAPDRTNETITPQAVPPGVCVGLAREAVLYRAPGTGADVHTPELLGTARGCPDNVAAVGRTDHL